MTTSGQRVDLDVTVGMLALCVDELRRAADSSPHAAELRLWADHLTEDLKTLRLLALGEDPGSDAC